VFNLASMLQFMQYNIVNISILATIKLLYSAS